LVLLQLFGSTAWPKICERRADCCRNGSACPMRMMQASGCHDQQHDTKNVVVHCERATMIEPPPMPLPRVHDAAFAVTDRQPLGGVGEAPERPPRLVSPLC
jgi:hypothetical protein